MKVLSSEGLTKLIQLIKSSFISVDNTETTTVADTVATSEVTLATVATTGAYSDLSGTPAINNATLTITQGGTTKGTFTANASSDVTIALDAGGGGGSYTAGDGIIIQNDEISVDAESMTEVDVEQMSEVTIGELLATVSGYDATKTQTLKNINGILTWVTEV